MVDWAEYGAVFLKKWDVKRNGDVLKQEIYKVWGGECFLCELQCCYDHPAVIEVLSLIEKLHRERCSKIGKI